MIELIRVRIGGWALRVPHQGGYLWRTLEGWGEYEFAHVITRYAQAEYLLNLLNKYRN